MYVCMQKLLNGDCYDCCYGSRLRKYIDMLSSWFINSSQVVIRCSWWIACLFPTRMQLWPSKWAVTILRTLLLCPTLHLKSTECKYFKLFSIHIQLGDEANISSRGDFEHFMWGPIGSYSTVTIPTITIEYYTFSHILDLQKYFNPKKRKMEHGGRLRRLTFTTGAFLWLAHVSVRDIL